MKLAKSFRHIINILLFLLFSTLLIAIAVAYSNNLFLYRLPGLDSSFSWLASYLSLLFSFQTADFILFLIAPAVLIILSTVFVLMTHSISKSTNKKVSAISCLYVFLVLILFSFEVCAGFLLGIKFARDEVRSEYSQIVSSIDADHKANGIVLDAKELKSKIEAADSESLRLAILTDYEFAKIVNERSTVLSNYSEYIRMNYIPNLIETARPQIFEADCFYYSGTIYFNSIANSTFSEINIPLAKLLITRAYPQVKQKADPKIEIVNLAKIKEVKNERIKEYLKWIDDTVKYIDSYLSVARESLVRVQAYYKQYGGSGWKSLVDGYKADIADLEAQKVDLAEQKVEYTKKLDEEPYEYGIFYSPDTIYLVKDTDYNDQLLSFIGTLVHEYVHYLADSATLDYEKMSGLEEGATDYLTNNIMLQNFGEYYPGYDSLVKVFNEFEKDMTEEKISQAFLSTDRNKLIALIDSTYGKGFYDKIYLKMNQLTESSKTADRGILNEILVLIEGARKK